ncbi:hypothetical protein POM88_017149 [Heracleum sosnowskyi]|uniref:ferroxidase n=1 Tax=Heracleum sosnowskyi TaxID=360622 RepID=A0AAD8INY8_9APIA|nr:hypothetical protein POM88_017149 [Heracleum sosnowskyi]
MGRLNALRRLLLPRTQKSPLSPGLSSPTSRSLLLSRPQYLLESSNCYPTSTSYVSRSFCSSGPSGLTVVEDEFHKLADSTIHHLLEKIEEFGDSMDIDGFDIDYGNQVLTVKFGNLGTYVLNKQTPNRQIWMSSPVSGPSRFDWDRNAQAWVYRRTKNYLFEILESELEQLCAVSSKKYGSELKKLVLGEGEYDAFIVGSGKRRGNCMCWSCNRSSLKGVVQVLGICSVALSCQYSLSLMELLVAPCVACLLWSPILLLLVWIEDEFEESFVVVLKTTDNTVRRTLTKFHSALLLICVVSGVDQNHMIPV